VDGRNKSGDDEMIQVDQMWKALWQKWTVDKPAAFGDWLWDVFVGQFAAFLDRLTWRRVVAILPVVALIFAYSHNIPVHPGLMLVGDLLAYIDIFAMLMLLGILGRVATIVFLVKQAVARVAELASSVMMKLRRLDVRHRRARGAKSRKRWIGQPKNDDDEPVGVGGFAWA
jgi:hypothetical protein